MSFFISWLMITLLVPAVHAAEGQDRSRLPRLGLLTWLAPPTSSSPTLFDEGLRDLGYVEGRNITVERRYANGDLARMPELARDLMRHSPDVLFVHRIRAPLPPSKLPQLSPL